MSQRMARVQKLARQVLGELIQDLKDPRVGFATVTAVRITADLRHARVFVSVLGDEAQQVATMAGLNSARPFLRTEISRQMRLKYSPNLVFELDHGPEEAQRLESLFRKRHEKEEVED